jgi:hypothetical protein
MAERKKAGRPKKLTDHKRFTVYLPTRMHSELRLYAVHQGKPLGDELVKVIASWWEGHPERGKYSQLASTAKKPAKRSK